MRGRRGFTLVEMLVSTALVLLIMVLFAQIYGAAVGTLREQEGLAKNDQKARAVVNILRSDLTARTYREIPLSHGNRNEPTVAARGLVPIHPRCLVIDNAQRGFFYLSENDPGDGTDDVLSFTMSIREPGGYFNGRVEAGTASQVNHPDGDDGISNDGMTRSRHAVVTYFLSDGRLHRRINLLRDPLSVPNPWQPDSGASFKLPYQPSNESALTNLGQGSPLFPYSSKYTDWYHTNALARQENPPGPPPPPPSPLDQVTILGAHSLDNRFGIANAPIGVPRFREGHNSGGNPTGEYSGTNFQGRAALTDARTGEDILLSGVVSFDVKVWEPQDANQNGTADSYEGVSRGGRFVDLGHGTLSRPDNTTEPSQTGPFCLTIGTGGNATWGRQNSAYNPGGPSGYAAFDTWHPYAPSGTEPPALPAALPPASVVPYYPLKMAPASGVTWTASSNYTVDTVVFPWGVSAGDYSVGYRVVTAGTTASQERQWERTIGSRVQDGTAVWQCFDNRIGLTGIRITVRFIDPGSNQVRQVTFDHSFLD